MSVHWATLTTVRKIQFPMHLMGLALFVQIVCIYAAIYNSEVVFEVQRKLDLQLLSFSKAFIYFPTAGSTLTEATLASVPHERIEFEGNSLCLLSWDRSILKQFPFIGSLLFAVVSFSCNPVLDSSQDKLIEAFAQVLFDYANALPAHLRLPSLAWWHGTGHANFYNKLYNSTLILLYANECISFTKAAEWNQVSAKAKKKILKRLGESSFFSTACLKNEFVLEEIIPRIRTLAMLNKTEQVKEKNENLGMFNFFLAGETLNLLLSAPIIESSALEKPEDLSKAFDSFANVTKWASSDKISFHSPNYSLLFAIMIQCTKSALHLLQEWPEEQELCTVAVEKLADFASLIKPSHYWQLQLSDQVYFTFKAPIISLAKAIARTKNQELEQKISTVIFRCFGRRIFHQIATTFNLFEEKGKIDHFRLTSDYFASLKTLLYSDITFKYAFSSSQFTQLSQTKSIEALIEVLKEASLKPCPFSDLQSFKAMFEQCPVISPWTQCYSRFFSQVLKASVTTELQDLGTWRAKKILGLLEFEWAHGMVADYLQENAQNEKNKFFVASYQLQTFSRESLQLAQYLEDSPANVFARDNNTVEFMHFDCTGCQTKFNCPTVKFNVSPNHSLCFQCLKREQNSTSFKYSTFQNGNIYKAMSIKGPAPQTQIKE